MIKELFTDGLIGLAIVLSLFRIDLGSINNLINYPEVQDIILGQTAAYLPANFHHIHNAPFTLSSPKHIELDNEAFNAWYQNIHSLPLFRERRQNEIEAFLVSGTHQASISEAFHNDANTDTGSESNVPEITSPTLPQESATSFVEIPEVTTTAESSTPSGESTTDSLPVVVDVRHLLNNPFPGCNLTSEDLNLINVLWQQDADLGVGKEVFDLTLRQELEREKELKVLKEQERQEAKLLSKASEEREKQEQAERWLKENYRQDGETGEWVRLQNGTATNISSSSDVVPLSGVDNSEDFLTLEAALDYLSASVDPSLLQNLEDPQSITTTSFTGFPESYSVPEFQEQELQQQYMEQPVSLDENWGSLVDYLNMAPNNVNSSSNVATTMQQMNESMDTALPLAPTYDMVQDVSYQNDYLIQNATMPAVSSEMTSDFANLTSENDLNSSVPLPLPTMNSSMDFYLNDLSFFNELATFENTTVDEFDLTEVDSLFREIQGSNGSEIIDPNMSLAESMDAIQMLEESFNHSSVSVGSASPNDLNDTFDGLEGATGGSDYVESRSDVTLPYSKVSRLSESSNDSGYAYQGGFSSSSSTSSSSSSCAGSPAASLNGGNSSTSSNDTEHDPHGTRAVAHHHVAHNHTYNTPPGQVPREVKKYTQKEPSRKGPQSRDQRRAQELKIPFPVDDIIESPVETFNEMLTSFKLNEAQLNLVKDIRRRGKNKVAAQNCRKRKVGVILTLEDEMVELQKLRDRLVSERSEMEKETRRAKEKMNYLYTHIFQSLRDERGEPYDPNLYSLQQSSDGNVFLVPRNLTINGLSNGTSPHAPPKNNASSKKRKSSE